MKKTESAALTAAETFSSPFLLMSALHLLLRVRPLQACSNNCPVKSVMCPINNQEIGPNHP